MDIRKSASKPGYDLTVRDKLTEMILSLLQLIHEASIHIFCNLLNLSVAD